MSEGETGRLRWRCRRGMRELDELLLRYFEVHYPRACDEEQRRFAELLELPDPTLWRYITGQDQPKDPLTQKILKILRARR